MGIGWPTLTASTATSEIRCVWTLSVTVSLSRYFREPENLFRIV